MDTVFLEIIFDADDFAKMNIEGRDEIEDPLYDALIEANIGEITGGGTGSGIVMIDVEIENEQKFDEGLLIIRQILRDLDCPKSTVIKRAKPSEKIYKVYD